MTGLEFNSRVGAIPIYPAASTYAFDGELVKLASNETPFAPHPQVLEAAVELDPGSHCADPRSRRNATASRR